MSDYKKSRVWCFTWNNYTEEDVEFLSNIRVRYIMYGREVGESGTPHLQGFIVFETQRHFGSVKSLMPRAHIEKTRGSIEQNINYVTKQDKEPYERGDRPSTQKEKGESEKRRWEDALAFAKAGEWESIDADIRARYERGLEYVVRKDRRKELVALKHDEVNHYWLYGPPGTGKSLRARTMANDGGGGVYLKDPKTKWWDGYTNQDWVIIDDFDKYQVAQGGEMKRWLDIYPFNAEFKGGYEMIRPKHIVVTSNYSPSEIWEDGITVGAIERRVNLEFMGKGVAMLSTFNK